MGSHAHPPRPRCPLCGKQRPALAPLPQQPMPQVCDACRGKGSPEVTDSHEVERLEAERAEVERAIRRRLRHAAPEDVSAVLQDGERQLDAIQAQLAALLRRGQP